MNIGQIWSKIALPITAKEYVMQYNDKYSLLILQIYFVETAFSVL